MVVMSHSLHFMVSGRDRSPVGRLVFKTRRGRQAVPGRFDSCSLPPSPLFNYIHAHNLHGQPAVWCWCLQQTVRDRNEHAEKD